MTGVTPCACSSQKGRIAKQDMSVPVLSRVAIVADMNLGCRKRRRSTNGRRAIISAGKSSNSAIQATENHAMAGIWPNTGAARDEMPAPTPRNIDESRTAPGMSMLLSR